MEVQDVVNARLRQIVGQPLGLTRRTLDLRQFHFGPLTIDGAKRWGRWSLHIACPWRLDGPSGLVTGSADFRHRSHRVGPDVDRGSADYFCRQDEALAMFMGAVPQAFGRLEAVEDPHTVVQAEVDERLVLEVRLSGGFLLTVMSAGVEDEAWRFFSHEGTEPHVVIIGDHVEGPEDE
jgi:hypothetical protein